MYVVLKRCRGIQVVAHPFGTYNQDGSTIQTISPRWWVLC